MNIDDRWVAPVNLDAMSRPEREAYARGLEAAANLLSVAHDDERLAMIGFLRSKAASARTTTEEAS